MDLSEADYERAGSIVPSLVGIVGKPGALPVGSYVVVGITFAVGVAATIAQLQYADDAQ